jgi:hypothetical protein
MSHSAVLGSVMWYVQWRHSQPSASSASPLSSALCRRLLDRVTRRLGAGALPAALARAAASAAAASSACALVPAASMGTANRGQSKQSCPFQHS